jgi:hypothetical protein
MKIAISGTHSAGKTTLVEELSRALPTYDVVDEPYYLLEEEGHQFAESLYPEDFQLQLERSIKCIDTSGGDTLFDRCPVDFLAYLFANRDFRQFDVERWVPRVRGAVEQLGLVVFVPVEKPDRIHQSDPDHARLRRCVNEHLRQFLFENPWKFEVNVLEVTGTPRERARRVVAHLERVGP